MKKEELRVGNKVLYKGRKNILIDEVKEIHTASVRLCMNPLAIYSYADLKPIRLTNKLLKKCGFWRQFTGEYVFLGDGPMEFYFHNKEFFISGSGNFDEKKYKVNIQYLHQLQNLYYMLCGTELEVKF